MVAEWACKKCGGKAIPSVGGHPANRQHLHLRCTKCGHEQKTSYPRRTKRTLPCFQCGRQMRLAKFVDMGVRKKGWLKWKCSACGSFYADRDGNQMGWDVGS